MKTPLLHLSAIDFIKALNGTRARHAHYYRSLCGRWLATNPTNHQPSTPMPSNVVITSTYYREGKLIIPFHSIGYVEGVGKGLHVYFNFDFTDSAFIPIDEEHVDLFISLYTQWLDR